MKLIKKIKLTRGSVLVFTLIVLFIGVAAALGIASTTVISQKMAGTTGKSVGSFQVADSGAEIFLKAIKDAEGGDTLGDLGSCNSGTISGNIGTGKNYNIIAYKLDGSTITNCNTAISEIDKIKSTGTYANTSRAVEMAVAAGGEKYQISCTPGTNSSNVICCMINKTSGDVNCQLGPATTGEWNPLLRDSWPGTGNGIYNLSCNLVGESNLLHCCRLNSVSSNTQCASYQTSHDLEWKPASNPSWL